MKYTYLFLNEDLDNMWKLFLRKKLSLNFYLPTGYTHEYAGIVPKIAEESADNLTTDDNLARFLDEVKIKDNSVTFITLRDFHDGMYDIKERLDGLPKLYDLVGREMEMIFDKLNRDMFDIVLIFSDHGCIMEGDNDYMPSIGRIKIYNQLWVKNAGIDKLTVNDKLCSCMDIFPTMAQLLNGFICNRIDGVSLLSNYSHPFVVIEDFFKRKTTTVHQTLEWWAIIFSNTHIITDIGGNWYISDGHGAMNIQISPEDRTLFEAILCNYASQYADTLKERNALNGYIKAAAEGRNRHFVYSTGEDRFTN